jgi:hypothetical protein
VGNVKNADGVSEHAKTLPDNKGQDAKSEQEIKVQTDSSKEKSQLAEGSRSQPLASSKDEPSDGNLKLTATSKQDATLLKQRRKKLFQLIIIKCVLQLLLIQTVDDLLNGNETVCASISTPNLLVILGCIERSYEFARKFNEDLDLRVSLWRLGMSLV